MKKILLLIVLIIIATGIFFSCKKETSCEGCAAKNQPPNAMAGPDQVTSLPTDSIILDGSSSSDPDGKITGWLWTKISGPASFNIVDKSSSKTIAIYVAGGYENGVLTSQVWKLEF